MSATPELYGRSAELRLLQEQLERALAGEQQLVLLEGDAGIGKTALLHGLARLQREPIRRSVRFLYLQAPDDEPYRPVHHAAMAAADLRLYARLGGRRQARQLATDWLSVIPVWGNLIAAVTATANLLARRRREGFGFATVDEDIDALLTAAARRPLVLLLDQLERADRVAIGRLERLIFAAGTGARILIVGAYRPAAPGTTSPPVHQLLRSLPEGNEVFLHHRLGPLDRDEVEAWLRGRFPHARVPDDVLDWLLAVSGGHPATLARALAHLQVTGAIRRARGRWVIGTDPRRLELPVQVQPFADLSGLHPETAEVLASAGLLGDEFEGTTLARMLGRDELRVEDQLAAAVHLGLLASQGERSLPDGEISTLYRFTSPHLRAALSQRIDAEHRRRLLHGADRAGPGAGA